MYFSPAEDDACRRLVEIALDEDLGPVRSPLEGRVGDLTSQAFISEQQAGSAAFVARTAGVVAGLPAAAIVLAEVGGAVGLRTLIGDGKRVQPGDRIATVAGPMRLILTAERTALNFLQRLSGVATLTQRYVDAVAGLRAQVLDTRKTTPGWRVLEKYAVRCGGGKNHRMGLYDGVLVKDNHLAALGGGADAFRRLREELDRSGFWGDRPVPLEIEVDRLDQLDGAFACRPDVVLLDNMTLEMLREAVRLRTAHAPKVLLEASGGVNLDTIRAIAETGVDRISVGALTHSAPALDIALDYGPG